MPRARSPNRDKVKQIYLQSGGKKKLKDSQIRKWKSQDKWEQDLKGALLKANSNVTKQKSKNNSPVSSPKVKDELVVL